MVVRDYLRKRFLAVYKVTIENLSKLYATLIDAWQVHCIFLTHCAI